MKNLISLLLMAGLLVACKTEKSSPRGVAASGVKNVKLNFLNLDKNRKIIYGDSILVQLDFDSTSELSKVDLKVGNRRLQTASLNKNTLYIDSKELGGGYYAIKAEVMLMDSTLLKGSGALSVVLADEPEVWEYNLIETYPHDDQSYTQGLIWHDNSIFESAGLYARSDIRQVKLQDGGVIQKMRVDDMYFAEGLTLYNNELYQITWREKTVMVYNPDNLQQKRTFTYTIGNGEGWGLTHNGSNFIFSDGSANLYFLNPEDWSVTRELRVFDHRGDVTRLNELEFVNGNIYANILDDNRIVVISPETGAVKAYWQLETLLNEPGMQNGRLDVMNGIAYHSERKSFLVTGKLWPKLFEIMPVKP